MYENDGFDFGSFAESGKKGLGRAKVLFGGSD